MKATKRIGCALLTLIFLLLAGCAAPPQTKAGETVSDFVFGENGYEYAPAPYGSTREETEAAIGSEMVDNGPNPYSEPFVYSSYITPEQNITLIGPKLKSRVDAQFTEDDKLFAITFTSGVYPDQREAFIESCRTNFTELFGKPDEDTVNDNGFFSISWEDPESGTVFSIQVYAPTVFAEQESEICRVTLGVFEKWRYVEAGVGEWASE